MTDDNVVFYTLNQKFVDSDDDLPEQAQQVMYYSLAIGHHVGVIDCLKTLMSCPTDEYKSWISMLPEGTARQKMTGLLTFGEITIDSTHTQLLAQAWDAVRQNLNETQAKYTKILMQALYDIEKEPAIYLMVRRRN